MRVYLSPADLSGKIDSDGTLPPLVVMIHGGPTSGARPWFALAYQFWTTRGFAIVDVDHRGSTGYGTEFRNLLRGWRFELPSGTDVARKLGIKPIKIAQRNDTWQVSFSSV